MFEGNNEDSHFFTLRIRGGSCGFHWKRLGSCLFEPGRSRSGPLQSSTVLSRLVGSGPRLVGSCPGWSSPEWSGLLRACPVQSDPLRGSFGLVRLCVPGIASWHTRGVAKPLGFMLTVVHWVCPKTSLICIDRLELSGHKNQFRWRAMNAI